MLSAALLLLPSCVYDTFDSDGPFTSAESYALSLTVDLPVTGGTKAGEDDPECYEDYIDPAGIRLLFFNARTNKLIREFMSSQLSFIPLELTSRYTKKWHVHIPVKPDEDADFIAAVRAEDFRIAVLANWPVADGKPLLRSGDHIDKLHHLADDIYKGQEKIYGFLSDKEKYGTAMGLTTDWASSKITTDSKGNQWNTGVMPTVEQPIPMYGIQEFGALKDVWKEDTVFDLSNFDRMTPPSYKYSDIWLLRSVAKVELLIPASMEPHSVFLRSANRSARCEPVDVIANTKDIWFDTSNANTSEHDSNCEWSQLVNNPRAPFYNPEGTLDSYQDALAWYYGRWDYVRRPVADTDGEYPHILNPVIDRSDFTCFLETESEETQYKRYVLYVPEKFVDDPEIDGDPTSDPKVCHIEFRVSGDPTEDLDDDNCYRIYFVDKGMTGKVEEVTFEKDESGTVLNWENMYEKDLDNLKQHWPIMRNHWYTFTVKDANSMYLNVNVQILAWKKQEFTVSW